MTVTLISILPLRIFNDHFNIEGEVGLEDDMYPVNLFAPVEISGPKCQFIRGICRPFRNYHVLYFLRLIIYLLIIFYSINQIEYIQILLTLPCYIPIIGVKQYKAFDDIIRVIPTVIIDALNIFLNLSFVSS